MLAFLHIYFDLNLSLRSNFESGLSMPKLAYFDAF